MRMEIQLAFQFAYHAISAATIAALASVLHGTTKSKISGIAYILIYNLQIQEHHYLPMTHQPRVPLFRILGQVPVQISYI